MSDSPVLLPVASIDPYPRNPRRFADPLFEERLAAIFKERGAFDPAYAIIVRPKVDERYEALGGNRRLGAAHRGGLTSIWCWVRNPKTEDEAFDIAVESNNQEGLSKLELGLVALELERAPGRAGKGVTAFAREHRVEGSLGRYQKGARVFLEVEADGQTSENVLRGCRDLAEHLAQISDAPRDRWVELVERVVGEKWSIKETERVVAQALSDATAASTPSPSPDVAEVASKGVAPVVPLFPGGPAASDDVEGEEEGEDVEDDVDEDDVEHEGDNDTEDADESEDSEDHAEQAGAVEADASESDGAGEEAGPDIQNDAEPADVRMVSDFLASLAAIRLRFPCPANMWSDVVAAADAAAPPARVLELLQMCVRLGDVKRKWEACPDKRRREAMELKSEERLRHEALDALLKELGK